MRGAEGAESLCNWGCGGALFLGARASIPVVTKHSAENEMGRNIRQLQARRGVTLVLFRMLVLTAATEGLCRRKIIYS